ncbi:MAG: PQQ-binding-like beta-propeller repeat protein [Chloroflexia bacterium]
MTIVYREQAKQLLRDAARDTRADNETRQALGRAIMDRALKLGEGMDTKGYPLFWTLDCREVLLDSRCLKQTADLLWEQLRRYRPDAVGGVTMSADPLTYALLCRAAEEGYPLKGFVIRKEQKSYGLGKLVEGPDLPTGARVVLLDDTLNSGTTIQKAVETLQGLNVTVEVVAVATVLNYERVGSRWLVEQGIPFEYLFTLRELGLRINSDRIVLGEVSAPDLLWAWEGLNKGRYGAPKSGPCFSPDGIFVGSDRGFLLSLTFDGKERWRYPVRDAQRGVHSTPAYNCGRVYFGAYDGYLYCLDAKSGELVWEVRPGEWIGSSPALDREQDRVFVGIEYGKKGGRLVAVEGSSGATVWEAELGGYVHSSPFFSSELNLVIVGCNDGYLYAADATSGEIKWSYLTGGEIKGNPVVDEVGRVYFGSFDGYLYCLAATGGELIWQRRISNYLYMTPLVWNDYVIAGGFTGLLTALDRITGKVRWSTNLGGRILGGIVQVGEDVVCLGCGNWHLFYVDAASGEVLRRYKTGRPLRTTPGVYGEQVVVPACDTMVYAFSTSCAGIDSVAATDQVC